jgi:anti-anti-sigma factor
VSLVEVNIADGLDLARLPRSGPVFDRILSLVPEHVVVDLSGCRHIDAAAIGFLLDVHRQLFRRGATLTIRNPNARIRRILQAARIDQVVGVVSTGAQDSTATAGHHADAATEEPARATARVAAP